jgi:hypothetical protein
MAWRISKVFELSCDGCGTTIVLNEQVLPADWSESILAPFDLFSETSLDLCRECSAADFSDIYRKWNERRFMGPPAPQS